MKPSQNPFSLYDFLGYFVPGAFAIFSYCLGVAWVDKSLDFIGTMRRFGLDTAEAYLPFVILAYVLGHIFSYVSSVTVERYSVWVNGYPSKYLLGVKPKGYWQVAEHKRLWVVIRFCVGLLLLPISLLDLLIGRCLGLRELHASELDPLLKTTIQRKVARFLAIRGEIDEPDKYGTALEHDFFRPVYHYTLEQAPNHQPKFQNYVALYGFLRTITLIMSLLFWASLLLAWKHHFRAPMPWVFVVFTGVSAYVLFLGFMKFYRRFSLEALMALVVVLPETYQSGSDVNYSSSTQNDSVYRWFGEGAVYHDSKMRTANEDDT